MATHYRATETETRVATNALLVVAAVSAGLLAAFLGLNFQPKIVLGLLIGMIFGTGIVLHPQIGVVFLVAAMPVINIFPPTFFGSGVANPTNLVLGWVAMSILLHRIFVLRVGIAKRAFLPPIIAYACVLVYSIAYSMLTGEGGVTEIASLTRTYLNGAFLYFLAANVVDDIKNAKMVFWAVIATVVMTALWGLLEYQSDLLSGVPPSRIRISGRVGQPNSFGAYLSMYLPFVLGLARLGTLPRLLRLAAIGGTVACVFALMFTQSRGAYVGTVAMLVFYGIIINRKILLVLLVALPAYQLWVPQQVIDRVMVTFEGRYDGEYDRSTNKRLDFYAFGVQMWKESPIWGHGFGSFNRMVKASGVAEKERAAHSLIIQMLAETGIVGIGTLFVMLGYFFRRAWKFYRSTENEFMRRFGEAYCGCIVALVIVNIFGVRFYNFLEIGYFWVLSALLVRFTEPMARGASRAVRRIEEAA